MVIGLPEPFPRLASVDTDDLNPAIRLFGKRFYNDQSDIELLSEFLAVALCEKRLSSVGCIEAPLPEYDDLLAWPSEAKLQYRPPIKLNLKLFALLGVSRVDTRHPIHVQHYERLLRNLRESIVPLEASDKIVDRLEELLQGFQAAGFDRTWCAQTFLPISSTLLTQEVIWNRTTASREPALDWYSSIEQLRKYYSLSRHRFLARGGELLYLQICIALRAEPGQLAQFLGELSACESLAVTRKEADREALHARLADGLAKLDDQRSRALDRLVDHIENLDPATSRMVNHSGDADAGWLSCEWCPSDSWREGYLFAIELSRLLRASLGPVERLEMLVIGCSLQLLRSLCAQSARYAGLDPVESPLHYAWVMTPTEGASPGLRLASQRNLQAVQRMIQRALRTEALRANAEGIKPSRDALYREADSRYGHKLFVRAGKRLGLLAPRTGARARFVMTEPVLRYLVLALLRPGERCTYDRFLERLHLHYGICIIGERLDQGVDWSGIRPNRSIQPEKGGWLPHMLRASGFLLAACRRGNRNRLSVDQVRFTS